MSAENKAIMRIIIEERSNQGDRVTTRFTARGTYQGELMGIQATGEGSDHHRD